MKKILLCGATHGSNFGDSLFAYMFKKIIESQYDRIEVLFTRASQHSKDKIGIKAATIKELMSCDGLVYISGGYFGEAHNESLKGAFFRFWRYFIYGLLMIIRRKPIAILGVGAGPLNRSFLRKIAVYIFNKAKIISVRDNQSRIFMENYGVKNTLITTSDSAQVIDDPIFNIRNSNKYFINYKELKNREKILIHINRLSLDDLYFHKIIKTVKETLYHNDNYGFIITSDSNIGYENLELVYNELPKDRTIIYEFTDLIKFLDIIASVDIIITPKLHVGILGSTYGKSVLSFPIHPGKTKRYYEQIGYSKHCKSLYTVTKQEVRQMINDLITERINLPENIKKDARMNFELLEKFIDMYIV